MMSIKIWIAILIMVWGSGRIIQLSDNYLQAAATTHVAAKANVGLMKKSSNKVAQFILERHRDSILTYFQYSSPYGNGHTHFVADTIIDTKNYALPEGWQVFLIKGEMTFMNQEQYEYDWYGIYKGDSLYDFDLLAQPVEITTELVSYEIDKEKIRILGYQWDMTGPEHNKNAHEPASLLCVPRIRDYPAKDIYLNDSTFIAELANLKPVREKEKEIGAMKYLVRQIPSKESPFYIIQTLKENEYRFEVVYNFYCYPQTGEIKLYQALQDSLIKIK